MWSDHPGERALLRTVRIACVLFALSGLAACSTAGHAPTAGFAGGAAGLVEPTAEGDIDLTPTVQPRSATYSCDDAGPMQVENLQTVVRITDPDGESFELPASPENQISRYGQTPTSLVLDGRDALYMKGNKSPISCRR